MHIASYVDDASLGDLWISRLNYLNQGYIAASACIVYQILRDSIETELNIAVVDLVAGD